jgi:hypothetical protein
MNGEFAPTPRLRWVERVVSAPEQPAKGKKSPTPVLVNTVRVLQQLWAEDIPAHMRSSAGEWRDVPVGVEGS